MSAIVSRSSRDVSVSGSGYAAAPLPSPATVRDASRSAVSVCSSATAVHDNSAPSRPSGRGRRVLEAIVAPEHLAIDDDAGDPMNALIARAVGRLPKRRLDRVPLDRAEQGA